MSKIRGGTKETMKGETTEEELLSTGGCRKRGLLGAKSRNDILGGGNSICKGREA